MMRKVFLATIFVLFFLSGHADGENWLHFIENEKGDKYYIDVDSIQQKALHTAGLLTKIEPRSSQDIMSVVSEIAVDCQGSRIRTLKNTTHFRNGVTKTARINEQFRTVGAEDIEESLMELVCSLKKTGQDTRGG